MYGDKLCSLRQSGDIDIYLEGGYKKVIDYANRTFPTKDVNELEIHYHCFNDVEVEIHYKPFVMDSPKDRLLQKYFNRSLEANYKNTILLFSDYAITALTFSFNIVHQLVHIHHHLFYEGVGLRQCMDYYFVLRNLNLDLNVNHNTNATFRSSGKERFAEAAMWMLERLVVKANGNLNLNDNINEK